MIPGLAVMIVIEMGRQIDNAPGLDFGTWFALIMLAVAAATVVHALRTGRINASGPVQRADEPARYWLHLLLVALIAVAALQKAFVETPL